MAEEIMAQLLPKFICTKHDLTMDNFLKLCHISFEEVEETLATHCITHWSAFLLATPEELRQLGFKWGPSQQLALGARQAIQITGPK